MHALFPPSLPPSLPLTCSAVHAAAAAPLRCRAAASHSRTAAQAPRPAGRWRPPGIGGQATGTAAHGPARGVDVQGGHLGISTLRVGLTSSRKPCDGPKQHKQSGHHGHRLTVHAWLCIVATFGTRVKMRSHAWEKKHAWGQELACHRSLLKVAPGIGRHRACRSLLAVPQHHAPKSGAEGRCVQSDGGARNNHQGDLAGPAAIHLQIGRKQSGEKDLLSHYDTNPVTFFSLDASLPGYTELVCTGTSACITR